jgi:pentatricopeptide repeat protein
MNKKLLIIVIVIASVALIGGGYLGYMVWRSSQDVQQSEREVGASDDVRQIDDREQLVEEVNQRYGEGNFTEAIRLIEGQKNADDPEVQILLAGAYANSGEVQKAFNVYKKLQEAGELPDVQWVNYAEMAERSGDKKAALEGYRKARDYAASSNAESPDQVAVYEYKIAELEAQQ